MNKKTEKTFQKLDLTGSEHVWKCDQSWMPSYTYRLKLGRWVNSTGWLQFHVEQAERDILYVGSYGIYSEQEMGGLRSEKLERTFKTVIPSDDTRPELMTNVMGSNDGM